MGQTSVQWAPCVTLALQYLIARGVGPGVSVKKADYTWLSLGPSAWLRVRVSDWVGLTAGVQLDVETAQPALIIEELGEVERVNMLEVSGLVGAEWIF